MESGRFAGFFRNAPFDKRSVLRVFLGFRPPFFHDPTERLVRGGVWGLSGSGAAGTGTREAGIDGWGAGPDQVFFLFFPRARFFF
jgi:hypothetical protein